MALRWTLGVELFLETGGLDTALFLDAPRVSVDKLTWKLERLDSDGDEDLSVVVVEVEFDLVGFASREPAVALLFLLVGSVSVVVDAVEVAAALTSLLRKLGAIYCFAINEPWLDRMYFGRV